jgi:AcrR family transcriptional regulator
MKKLRKTQEERRRGTQAAVLSAALQLLIARGYARFTAGQVAARAGVSRGALERYFPTRNDLLVAVTQFAMDTALDHARALATRASAETDPVKRFLLDSQHFFLSPVFRALIELAIAANDDPQLARPHRAIVVRARRGLNRIWLDALATAGFPRRNAERFILLTHYLLRGVFVVERWLPYDPKPRAVMTAWSALAPAVLELEQTSPPLMSVPKAPARSGRSRTRRRGAKPRK